MRRAAIGISVSDMLTIPPLYNVSTPTMQKSLLNMFVDGVLTIGASTTHEDFQKGFVLSHCNGSASDVFSQASGAFPCLGKYEQ